MLSKNKFQSAYTSLEDNHNILLQPHYCQFNHEIDTYCDEIGCRIMCVVPAETSRTGDVVGEEDPSPSKVAPWGKFFSGLVASVVSSAVKSL